MTDRDREHILNLLESIRFALDAIAALLTQEEA